MNDQDTATLIAIDKSLRDIAHELLHINEQLKELVTLNALLERLITMIGRMRD